MDDKCIIHCADHLCIHNSCSGYYGVCALSAMSVSARYGISRSYVNTCAKKVPIPNCIARGPGKIAVFAHGRAGNGKSTLEMERFLETVTFSFGEPKTLSMDEVMDAIRQFEEIPKPEITPWSTSPFHTEYLGEWHFKEEEDE